MTTPVEPQPLVNLVSTSSHVPHVYNVVMPSHTSVRDLDPDLWRQLRAAALMQGVPVGQLLNQIIKDWLAKK